MRWRRKMMKGASEMPAEVPVMRIQRNDWIVGWKISNLVLDTERQQLMFFRTIWDGIITGPDEVVASAVCSQKPYHQSPAHGCRCGFNAFSERHHALEFSKGESGASTAIHLESCVLLRVGLRGRVIEGTYPLIEDAWGYRAEVQHVSEMFIERECFACHEAVVGFSLEPCSKAEHMWRGLYFARQSCAAHYDRHHVSYDEMFHAATASGVGMHWRDE